MICRHTPSSPLAGIGLHSWFFDNSCSLTVSVYRWLQSWEPARSPTACSGEGVRYDQHHTGDSDHDGLRGADAGVEAPCGPPLHEGRRSHQAHVQQHAVPGHAAGDTPSPI
jgi:hypothetical protein